MLMSIRVTGRRGGAGRNGPDHREDHLHRDAHVVGGELVLRGRLHRDADAGVVEEGVEHAAQHERAEHDRQVLVAERNVADLPDAAEWRRQSVDLRAPGDAGESPEHRAEADGQHDHGELRLADHLPQHHPVEQGAERANREHRDQEADPIVEPPPDHGHKANKGAQHQQVALGEIHQLCRLVDEDKTKGDQTVDAAHCQAVEGQLEKNSQFLPPAITRSAGQRDEGEEDVSCLADQHKAERYQPANAAERDSAHQLLNEIQHACLFPHSGRRAIFVIVSSARTKRFRS
jgi:hypothetical protein